MQKVWPEEWGYAAVQTKNIGIFRLAQTGTFPQKKLRNVFWNLLLRVAVKTVYFVSVANMCESTVETNIHSVAVDVRK